MTKENREYRELLKVREFCEAEDYLKHLYDDLEKRFFETDLYHEKREKIINFYTNGADARYVETFKSAMKGLFKHF